MTKPSRAISRCNSAETFGGSAEPSGVCSAARRSAALRRVGLKLRMPSRARVLFVLDEHPRIECAAQDGLLVTPGGTPSGIGAFVRYVLMVLKSKASASHLLCR